MRWLTVLIASLFLSGVATAETEFAGSWGGAKRRSAKHIYFDHHETLYCGCTYESTSTSGGKPDHDSCGFENRTDTSSDTRANRIEWEHIVPASLMPARQHVCWTEGSRRECQNNGPAHVKMMLFDLHNLAPSVGQVNADRLNYRYGLLPDAELPFGQCPFKFDRDLDLAEPAEDVRGDVARVWLYMRDRYGVVFADGEEAMFQSWQENDSVSDWERERNNRIFCAQGTINQHVSAPPLSCD